MRGVYLTMFNDDNFKNNDYEINEYETKYEHNSGDGTKENPKVIDYWTEKQWREINKKQEKERKIEENKILRESILKTVVIIGIVVMVIFCIVVIGNSLSHTTRKSTICSVCHGTGTYHNRTCYRCSGDGYYYYNESY